jgi:Sulfotransferase domain
VSGRVSGRAVFVVSTGRTGTQYLATTFAGLGVRSHHEPGPWWLRHLSNAHASGAVGDARAQRLLHRVRDDELGSGEPWFEASCLIYGVVRPLLDAFPEAQVVQVVRAPASYVRSGQAWGAYRFGGRPLNVVPFRRLAPPQFDPWNVGERLRWVGQDQFARLCWAWAGMNRAMRTQGEGSDRFRTVRFEDLTDPVTGPTALEALGADLGLEVAPERLAEAVGQRVNASEPGRRAAGDWTPDQRQLLHDLTAEEAAHYGYSVD